MLLKFGRREECIFYFKYGQLLPSHDSMKSSSTKPGGWTKGSPQPEQPQQHLRSCWEGGMQPRGSVQRNSLQMHGADCQKRENNFKIRKEKRGVLYSEMFGDRRKRYSELWEKTKQGNENFESLNFSTSSCSYSQASHTAKVFPRGFLDGQKNELNWKKPLK